MVVLSGRTMFPDIGGGGESFYIPPNGAFYGEKFVSSLGSLPLQEVTEKFLTIKLKHITIPK